MLLALLRASRLLRALVLTVRAVSFLVWLYIVARIIVEEVNLLTHFLSTVPSHSVAPAGAYTFGLSALSMFVYLWLWGWPNRRPAAPWVPGQREP